MSPQDTWQAAPKRCQDGIFPIYDHNMALVVDGFDNLSSYLVGFEHHGVMEVSAQQIGIDKARADVGKADFQASCVSLLLQSL